MLKVGDVVVTMSYPGLFTVVALEGDDVRIDDGQGRTYLVRGSNVRRVTRTDAPTS
jgi:hypothetical protein